MYGDANTQDRYRSEQPRPDCLNLFVPKFSELAYNALLLSLVAVLNLHDGDRDSMSDATCSSGRHELSKIWYAALFSILVLVFRKGVDLVPDPIEKNQLIYHIFALEIFQIYFCNKSVQVNHPGEGMGFFSSWIKTHISSMLFGVSVGLLAGSNIVKTGFFGIPDQDQFYRDGTTPAQAQLERYSQVDITRAHNIGTLSYSGYILNLVMHLDSDKSLSKWKLLLISLLLLSAFIQVYARTRAVYGNSGDTTQLPVPVRVDEPEPASQIQEAVAVAVPLAEPVAVAVAVPVGTFSIRSMHQITDSSTQEPQQPSISNINVSLPQ